MAKIENKLERLLQGATLDPALRDEFYRELLEADVLVQVRTEHGTAAVGR